MPDTPQNFTDFVASRADVASAEATDTLPLVRSGATRRATLEQLRDLIVSLIDQDDIGLVAATQAEAEAGTEAGLRSFSPLRLAQAISALSGMAPVNQFAGDGPPGAGDDEAEGYTVGSAWIDQTATPPEAYKCADPSEGAAVWLKTTLTTDELALVAVSGAYADLTGRPTLGGAAELNVGTGAGTVAAGDDVRLSDARTPTAHTHNASDINAGTLADARIPNLNASKINAGAFPVARGGTGLASLTTGNMLRAASSSTMEQRTPTQVLGDIAAAPSARNVATQHSLQGGGDLTADRTLSLVGDVASPGANKVYGTNGAGARGWQDAPGGGSGMSNPMTTQGDIIYGASSGTPARLPIGSPNQVLTVDPAYGVPVWQPATADITPALQTAGSAWYTIHPAADPHLSIIHMTAASAHANLTLAWSYYLTPGYRVDFHHPHATSFNFILRNPYGMDQLTRNSVVRAELAVLSIYSTSVDWAVTLYIRDVYDQHSVEHHNLTVWDT